MRFADLLPILPLLAMSLTLVPRLIHWIRRRKLKLRMLQGRCVGCGYDLRGTSGRCPECGAVSDTARIYDDVLDLRKLQEYWPKVTVSPRRDFLDEDLKAVHGTDSELIARLLSEHLKLHGVRSYLQQKSPGAGLAPRVVVKVWSGDADFAREVIKIFKADSPAPAPARVKAAEHV